MESPMQPRRDAGDLLSIGFGTTVAMWAVGYFTHLPGVHAPGPLVFALVVLCGLAGGFVAGRCSGRGPYAGLWTGGISGLLNLLVLGSLLKNPSDANLVPSALLWLPGSLLISVGLGFAGALLGSRWPRPLGGWPARFAGVACAATLLLLGAGGAVTGFEAGLAVPDWPNSYGYNMFLYPISRMTGGIYFEHTHRLMGSLVGLTTLTLMVYLLIRERRDWVRGMAVIAFVLVVVQGLLGGLRVTGRLTFSDNPADLAPNLTIAVIHGVTAQVFFSLLVSLALILSDAWKTAPRAVAPNAGADHALNLAAVALLLAQLVLGALLRHYSWGLHLHVTMACVVAVAAATAGVRAWGLHGERPLFSTIGLTVLGILGAQLLLGVAALVAVMMEPAGAEATPTQVLITTLHQTTGAALLASTTALWVWSRRSLLTSSPVAASEPVDGLAANVRH